jgi:hypothetical protein
VPQLVGSYKPIRCPTEFIRLDLTSIIDDLADQVKWQRREKEQVAEEEEEVEVEEEEG